MTWPRTPVPFTGRGAGRVVVVEGTAGGREVVVTGSPVVTGAGAITVGGVSDPGGDVPVPSGGEPVDGVLSDGVTDPDGPEAVARVWGDEPHPASIANVSISGASRRLPGMPVGRPGWPAGSRSCLVERMGHRRVKVRWMTPLGDETTSMS